MKKTYLLIICIMLIIIIIICANILYNQNLNQNTQNYNNSYLEYLNKNIYGTDIITLINKAIDNNIKNNIEKNEKGLYQDDEKNSVIIEIVFIIDEEKHTTKTYRMENIEKAGISEFISNFDTAVFKSSNVEYHKQTGKISKITFEQLESISF